MPGEPASPVAGRCEPRSVAGATLVVTDETGREVLRITTSPDGTFASQLPASSYTITPQPVAGLLGVAPPLYFRVSPTEPTGPLTVEYDTGIR